MLRFFPRTDRGVKYLPWGDIQNYTRDQAYAPPPLPGDQTDLSL